MPFCPSRARTCFPENISSWPNGGLSPVAYSVDLCRCLQTWQSECWRHSTASFPTAPYGMCPPLTLLVLGTNERLDIDYQMLKERMSEPGIHKDLDSVHFGEPNDLLSTFLMADDDLAHFVSGNDAASDERPLGFLNVPDFGSRRDVQTMADDLLSHRASINPYLHNIGTSEDAEKNVRDALEAQSTAMGNVIRGELKLLLS